MYKKIAIGAGAVGATAALVFGLSAATSASARATPTCGGIVLRPSAGAGSGGAGTLQDVWKLKNVGPTTCQMKGFATVNNFRSDGRSFPMSITHSGTPHAVFLAPGQTAKFHLRYTNPAIRGCTAQNPAHMSILTPGSVRPVLVDGGLSACAGEASESPLVHQ